MLPVQTGIPHVDLTNIAPACFEVGAARSEIASLRPFVGQGQLAWNGDEGLGIFVRSGKRDRAEQTLRIGMPHPVEYAFNRAGFDRLAGIHHRDPVACFQDEAEIVRDEQHGRAEPAAEFLHHLDDAGFNRDIKRCRRLVHQQQGGLRQQRHGDDDALLLAAGKLVRI